MVVGMKQYVHMRIRPDKSSLSLSLSSLFGCMFASDNEEGFKVFKCTANDNNEYQLSLCATEAALHLQGRSVSSLYRNYV